MNKLTESLTDEVLNLAREVSAKSELVGTKQEQLRIAQLIPQIVDVVVNNFCNKGGPVGREKAELEILYLVTGEKESI